MDDEASILKDLQNLPNVGPATAKDLLLLGITSVEQLRDRAPDDLYRELCEKTGERQDPCVRDVFAALAHFASTGERRKWWEFTAERKASGR